MDVWGAMGRRVNWLEPGYFEAKLIQRCCALLTLLCLFEWGAAEQGSGDCQAFPVDEIGWRGADVGLERRSNREKGARESPEPFGRFILSERN